MLSTRRITFLGAALLLSGATVLMTQQWLQGQVRHAQAAARAQAKTAPAVRVLVAAQPLPAGTILKPGQLRWQSWPADASTAGYYTAAATTPAQLAGAVVRTELAPGEPLSAARVVQPGDRSFLAAVLKPGFRAVTINVSANTAVSGFAFPGDRVDLILSRSLEGGGGPRRFVSETLLSNVRLVGIDQRASNEKREVVAPQTATLEVTPKQAELIALASDLGRLTLSLRSLADPDQAPEAAQPGTRTWDTAPGLAAAPNPAAAGARARPSAPRSTPAPRAVMVVRGSDISSSGSAR